MARSGCSAPTTGYEGFGVPYLGDDVRAGPGEDVDDALAGEQAVLRHDYPHGRSSVRDRSTTLIVPPSASTRSEIASVAASSSSAPSTVRLTVASS